MRATIFLFLSLSALIGASCSSISQHECQNKDWSAFAKRYTQTQGLDYQGIQQAALRACSEHGIRADSKELKNGHKLGVELYCDRQKAWDLGLDGEKYNLAICPPDQRDGLEKVHATAELLYQIEDFESKAAEAADRISMLYSEISDIQKEKTQLLKNQASEQKVSLLDSKISALQIEIQREENQKAQALMRASQLSRRIQVYKQTLDSL